MLDESDGRVWEMPITSVKYKLDKIIPLYHYCQNMFGNHIYSTSHSSKVSSKKVKWAQSEHKWTQSEHKWTQPNTSEHLNLSWILRKPIIPFFPFDEFQCIVCMRAVQHFSHLFYIQFSLVYIHFIFCLTLNDFEWPEGMSLRKAYLTAHTVIHIHIPLHIDIKVNVNTYYFIPVYIQSTYSTSNSYFYKRLLLKEKLLSIFKQKYNDNPAKWTHCFV